MTTLGEMLSTGEKIAGLTFVPTPRLPSWMQGQDLDSDSPFGSSPGIIAAYIARGVSFRKFSQNNDPRPYLALSPISDLEARYFAPLYGRLKDELNTSVE